MLELILPATAALFALFLRWPGRFWPAPTRVLRLLGASPGRAIFSSALLTLVVCMALSVVRPPAPIVHDEFSYLLGADTFAHGRLTNPTHPLWRHFESFHVIHKPSYQSKYPPGQALVLAAGQALTGRPIVGVWIGMAAAAAALCWMMLAWAPPRWALLAGLLPVLRFGTLPLYQTDQFVYWSTTFWGGAVATGGAALVYGAVVRLMRQPRARDAALFASGLLVLANTRPFEGLVAAVPTAALLAFSVLRQRDLWRTSFVRILLAGGAVLVLGALWMGLYNFRTTGSPLRMPYQVHVETYEIAPRFVFQPLKADKNYNHQALRDYHYGFLLDAYKAKQEHSFSASHFVGPALFFWGFALAAPLFWTLGRPWNPWMIFAAFQILSSIAANQLAATTTIHYHYLAPVAPWFVFAAIEALRRLRAWRTGRIGRAAAESVIVSCVAALIIGCAAHRATLPKFRTGLGEHRRQILQQLGSDSRRDLIVVTYLPGHNPLGEWVYNGADLDGAPVVWARDMGPEGNKELLEYYSDRRIWRLRADENPPSLEPYSAH